MSYCAAIICHFVGMIFDLGNVLMERDWVYFFCEKERLVVLPCLPFVGYNSEVLGVNLATSSQTNQLPG